MIFFYPKTISSTNYSSKITAITKLPNIAYSNNIFEARFKEYKDFSKTLFPMPLQINNLDFVYEK